MLRLRGLLAVAVPALCLSCVTGEMGDPTLGGGGLGGSGGSGMAGVGGPTPTAGAAQTAASASSGGGGQLAGGAGSGSGGAVSCSTFADDAAWKLTVHIKNQRTTPVYLGSQTMGCGGARLFDVIDGGRSPLPALGSCRSSCTTVMTSGPVVCPTVCAAPSTVTLAPGQTIDIPWDGLFSVPNTVPAQCMQTAAPSATACVRAQQIKNGLFTFSAQAGEKQQCLTNSACTCTANPAGGCTTPNSITAGTIITTDFLIALDPGESSVGTDPQYIGLVFKD